MTGSGEFSEPGKPNPEVYASYLRSLMLELQYQTREIEGHKASMRRTWDRITELTRTNGVPEEAKFEVAALHYRPTDSEATAEFVDKLKGVDEQVKASAGQLAAWLTSEIVQTSHPFNPSVAPQTEQRAYFHVGLLPTDARLVVGDRGNLSIPIEKSALVPLSAVPLPETFEDELHPLPTLSYDRVALEINPSINLNNWSKNYPLIFLLGDEAVKGIFERDLKGYPEPEQALDLLTATLF